MRRVRAALLSRVRLLRSAAAPDATASASSAGASPGSDALPLRWQGRKVHRLVGGVILVAHHAVQLGNLRLSIQQAAFLHYATLFSFCASPTTHGQFEDSVRAMARKADTKGLPPARGLSKPEAIEALTAMAKRFGIEIVGPPMH